MDSNLKTLRTKLQFMPKIELVEIADDCGMGELDKEILIDFFISRKSIAEISQKHDISVETLWRLKRRLMVILCNYYKYISK